LKAGKIAAGQRKGMIIRQSEKDYAEKDY